MMCPDCNHKNRPGEYICQNCYADLYDLLLDEVETKQINRSQTRELLQDALPKKAPLVMYIGNQKTISLDRLNGIIIGRCDPENKRQQVDIDLTNLDAQMKGVSRRHARLDADTEIPLLIDLDSYNGTFINGQRLSPHQPYALESGDEVTFGHMTMYVYYK